MSLVKGIPPLQDKKAYCKRYFQCGCCPSQQTTRHALAGLLTCELGSLGPSRRDSNNGQKIRTSYKHSLTAAGPSRIHTGIPCCRIAQEGQSITNALGGNILRLQTTHKHPRPRVSFGTVSLAGEKSPSPSAAFFVFSYFPRCSLTVQRVHRPDLGQGVILTRSLYWEWLLSLDFQRETVRQKGKNTLPSGPCRVFKSIVLHFFLIGPNYGDHLHVARQNKSC